MVMNLLKGVFITLISAILNLIAIFSMQSVAESMPQYEMTMLKILIFALLPIVSIIIGVVSQNILQKVWASAVITAISLLFCAPAMLIYIPLYAIMSSAASIMRRNYKRSREGGAEKQ